MSDYVLEVEDGIAQITLNRPKKGNALSAYIWNNLPNEVSELDRSGQVRALIIQSEGQHFCTGMDLAEFKNGIPDPDSPAARESFYHLARSLQETFTCLERARFPVFSAIQGACLGAGLELAAACDLRFATPDTVFRLEEINVGIMADVGALQRLPKILPDAVMRRMAFLGTPLSAVDALAHGFVADICEDAASARAAALSAAKIVRDKAPVAISGTKAALRWARDHSVPDALEWSARTQSALWSTRDIQAAVGAKVDRKSPHFQELAEKGRIG